MSATATPAPTTECSHNPECAQNPECAESSPAVRRVTRLLTVLAAAAAGSVGWAVADPLLGVDLVARPIGSPTDMEIGLPMVILASLFVGLAGWGLLAVLERTLRRGRHVWTIVAGCVLGISLHTPLSGAHSVSATVSLWCLHVIVGGVILAGMRYAVRVGR